MSITEADKVEETEVGEVGVACDVGIVVDTDGDTHVLFLKWVGCVVGAAAEAFPVAPACAAALLLTFMLRARLGDGGTDELVDTLR